MEQIQIVGFFLQESLISGLYVYYTRKLLKPCAAFQRKKPRQVMKDLILVNILIILMDATLLGTEASNHYEIQVCHLSIFIILMNVTLLNTGLSNRCGIQTTYKSMLYSVKLKLEFAILNQLVSITHMNTNPFDNLNTADIHRPSAVSDLSSSTVGGPVDRLAARSRHGAAWNVMGQACVGLFKTRPLRIWSWFGAHKA